jgi:hypothetical protein
MMEKFNFLIGKWSLKYTVPKSLFSVAAAGKGEGTFRRALNDKYVFFDYRAELTTGSAQAHGIFARDVGNNIYRYWWFEDSGSYRTATCNFTDDHTLFMNWHDTILIQTFEKISDGHIVLKMLYPVKKQDFKPILVVDFLK